MTTKTMLRGAAVVVAALASTRMAGAQAGLTIYNQNFGVVRDTVVLNLQRGENDVRVTDTTALLEPDSVVLRDPSGKRALRVLEQNFRADALSQDRLLSLYEGKTIDFLINRIDGTQQIVQGKIVRSGVLAPPANVNYTANGYYYLQNGGTLPVSSGQPIIEVDGKMRFQLPGVPLFPSLGDDTILKPSLNWKLVTDAAGPLNAELSYVTGGMTWSADYNVVSPENSDVLDLTAWVTLTNNSGKSFPEARIQLMAGDVRKVQPNRYGYEDRRMSALESRAGYAQAQVTQKDFDEYHLYTLARASTLRDRETKQVEFARSARVQSKLIYVYDGVFIDPNRYSSWSYENIRDQSDYGTQSNPKVWVMREFVNSQANGLGIPLPKGRVRFYRRETASGALQFVGENVIDHTPQGETVRVNTGNSFDLVGARKRLEFKRDPQNNKWADETFEITLRNRKKTAVEVRVVEHLYRWTNWEITQKSQDFTKTDAQTIEFRVPLAPNEEKKITYTVHYSW